MKNQNKKSFRNVLILPLCFLSFGIFAQEGENLVKNGSFEAIEGKVKKLGAIENSVGWSSPTGSRADLFTPSKVPDINAPQNVYGKEDAKEGVTYAGLVGFSYGDKVPRTYISQKLATPLKKGMKYCVKFHVSLAEASKFSSNQIGAHFSAKPFSSDAKISIIETTHVLQSENKVFSAMYNWEEVCGEFVASGGEKYITLGNFTSNENTKSEKNRKPSDLKGSQVISAYYYIDEVSVVLVTEGEKCACVAGGDDEEFYSPTIYQKSFLVDDKMSAKEVLEIQELYFAFGKTKLSQAGMESLELVTEIMLENKDFKIEISGHNNEKEDLVAEENDYYENMDEKRMQIVVDYLIDNGVEETRIIAAPKDATVPNPEVTEYDSEDIAKAKSRRVSFKIVE